MLSLDLTFFFPYASSTPPSSLLSRPFSPSPPSPLPPSLPVLQPAESIAMVRADTHVLQKPREDGERKAAFRLP